ncbi:recombinase zinc beta ribbon domain-containing protein [Pseudoflavitalea rhizosphaerae]|uniref:recombinase zinc beta ribbon domain-containing protein n=1 Tax=Pseudoflavitalea rhizosphaerae TaxID=1884793 RepID=UPI0013E082A8|nr:recombinase zinc beta ribbon domain-containing protein [Pseudoflavitalea rhizosphaerae]
MSLGYPRSFNAFLRAIRNPIYCGKILIKDDTQNSPLFIEGLHEAIIEDEVFFKVQSLLNRKKINPRKSKSNPYLPLRGILKCPKCGKMLTGSGSKNRTEKVYYYYHCQSKCGTRFPANVIHQKFRLLLESLNLTDFHKFILQQIVYNSIQDLLQHELTRSGRLLRKIEICEQKPQKIRALLLEGSIDPDEYKIFIEECTAQLHILRGTLKNSEIEITRIKNINKDVLEKFSDFARLFDLIKIENQQEFAKWVYPYGIEVLDDSFSAANIDKLLHPIFTVTGKREV